MTDYRETALANLEKHGVQTSILMTVIRGLNDDEIGSLLKFTLSKPFICGFEVQTMAYTGAGGRTMKFNPMDRVTGTDLILNMEKQSDGVVKMSDFVPMLHPHPNCVAITYVLGLRDGTHIPFLRFTEPEVYKKAILNQFIAHPDDKHEALLQRMIDYVWTNSETIERRRSSSIRSSACSGSSKETVPADRLLSWARPRARARTARTRCRRGRVLEKEPGLTVEHHRAESLEHLALRGRVISRREARVLPGEGVGLGFQRRCAVSVVAFAQLVDEATEVAQRKCRLRWRYRWRGGGGRRCRGWSVVRRIVGRACTQGRPGPCDRQGGGDHAKPGLPVLERDHEVIEIKAQERGQATTPSPWSYLDRSVRAMRQCRARTGRSISHEPGDLGVGRSILVM
jgi:hypothetical protein